MGNSSVKFDIISSLPRELVLMVVSNLSLKDVNNCLLVSRSWNEIISHLAPYWWTAIERHVGLSREAIARSAPAFSTPRALFIAIKKYKTKVGSNKLKTSPVNFSSSTDVQFTLCLEAKEMMIVQSQKLKENNQNCIYRLSLERFTCRFNSDNGRTEINTEPSASYSLEKGSSVAWVHVAGDNLYWVTRCGTWRGINWKSQEEIFSWNNNLLNNGCGVTIACCKDCSMVVASQWMPLAGDNANLLAGYALQVVSLGRNGQGTPQELVGWKMFQTRHNHRLFLHHDSRYWIRETLITSGSHGKRRTGGKTLCHQHTLIVQSDRCTVLHTIELQDHYELAQSQTNGSRDAQLQQQLKIGPGYCINCAYGLQCDDESMEKHYTRNVSSGVNLSSDQTLMGMVFKNELHVWKFSPVTRYYYRPTGTLFNADNNGVELVSKAALKRKSDSSGGGPSNSIRLVALGHNLSIIAYHHDTYVMDYQLQVVMTHSGEVVMELRHIERFYDWSLCCQVDPLHKFYFMTLDEDWLNNVQCNNIVPVTPIITVHNHHGRMHIEAIQCYRPEQSWRKHWRCYMQ